MGERADSIGIGLLDNLVENGARLGLGAARDRKRIDSDLDGMAIGLCLGTDVIDLLLDLLGRISIGEVPVRDSRSHVARGARTSSLENFRLRINRLWFQGIVVEAIEIATEGEIVLSPDSAQRANELLGATIALIMIEPGLADRRELAAEPSAYHIDGHAAFGQMVDGRDLLGRKRRIPRPG